MQYLTNYGVLDASHETLPADLTREEAEYIAKARWDAVMDVFDARMVKVKNHDGA